MKVHEIIKLLQKLPQDLEVVIASDDEGNSFRHIPKNWVGVEKFYCSDLIHEDDYSKYKLDDLSKFVVIG